MKHCQWLNQVRRATRTCDTATLGLQLVAPPGEPWERHKARPCTGKRMPPKFRYLHRTAGPRKIPSLTNRSNPFSGECVETRSCRDPLCGCRDNLWRFPRSWGLGFCGRRGSGGEGLGQNPYSPLNEPTLCCSNSLLA